MKNPILPISIGFIAGTALGLTSTPLLLPISFGFVIAALLAVWMCKRGNLKSLGYSSTMLAASAAFAIGGFNGQFALPSNSGMESELVGKSGEWHLRTTSTSSPTKTGFRTEASLLSADGKTLDSKIIIYSSKEIGQLQLGAEVQVDGVLKEVEGPEYFVQFCQRKGIEMVLQADQLEITGREMGLMAFASDLQHTFSALFRKHLGKDAAGLLSALILGEKNGLDRSEKQAFATSGLSHVLAISGMHVGIIFSLLIGMIKPTFLYRRGSGWVNFFLLALLWAYAMICGLSPAVVRAVILISLFLLSETLRWQIRKMNLLAFAAMAMLFFVPQWVLDAGFQLSFCATAGILWGAKPLEKGIQTRFPKIPTSFASGLAVSLVAQAFTLPLILIHFGTFPTWFLISNLLIAVPALWTVRLGFLALCLLWIPGLNSALGFLLDALAHFLSLIPSLIAKLPFATTQSFSFADGGFVTLVMMVVGVSFIWFRPMIRQWWDTRKIEGNALSIETRGFHLAAGLFLLCFVIDLIG